MYLVYILKSCTYSYVGMTNDFFRRWRQHNKEIKGGAKYTSKRNDWYPICIIDGFNSMKEACQCEWAIKHCRSITHHNGPTKRILNLNKLLTQKQWTSKSPQIKDQSLIIYIDEEYKHLLSVKTRELYWK